jgi:hypothetical protein
MMSGPAPVSAAVVNFGVRSPSDTSSTSTVTFFCLAHSATICLKRSLAAGMNHALMVMPSRGCWASDEPGRRDDAVSARRAARGTMRRTVNLIQGVLSVRDRRGNRRSGRAASISTATGP